jgi:hypothetical protein
MAIAFEIGVSNEGYGLRPFSLPAWLRGQNIFMNGVEPWVPHPRRVFVFAARVGYL